MNFSDYNHYLNVLNNCVFYCKHTCKNYTYECTTPENKHLRGVPKIAEYFKLNNKSLYNASVELQSIEDAIKRLLHYKFIGKGNLKFVIVTEDGTQLRGMSSIASYYGVESSKLYYRVNHGIPIKDALDMLLN